MPELQSSSPVQARVVTSYPLVTVSKTHAHAPFAIVPLLAEHMPNRQSLNLIQLTWSYESPEKVEALLTALEAARSTVPSAEFVVLANTEFESYLLSSCGIPNTLTSETIFIDENIFRPRPEIERTFDSVYNGRLAAMKRHELAEGIESRLLIYGPGGEYDREYFDAYLRKPSSGVFLNHQLGSGEYRLLTLEETAQHMNRAHVGLCLSATEGIMRASIEYLLTGLPVVSTPCYGGRERYYHPDYCRIVEPDMNAVTKGVRELKEQKLDPFFVRRRTLSIINRERTNFVRFVNSLVRYHFKIRNLFTDFEPFRGDVKQVPVRNFIDRLKGKPGS